MSNPFATVTKFPITQFMVGLFATTTLACLAVCATGVVGAVGTAAGRAVCRRLRRIGGDAGMSTAEYAVGTIAACAFAAVLYQVVTGDSIVSALRGLITSALSSLS